MFQKRLIWQLYPSFLLITVLSLLAVTWYSTRALRTLYIDTLTEDLQTRAGVIENRIRRDALPMNVQSIDPVCKSMRESIDCRITVILPNGNVIGESDEQPEDMENHKNRPEIQQAYQGSPGKEIRYSHTVFKNMMYVAVPVRDDSGRVIAVVRTSMTANAINESLRSVYFQILLGGLAVALVAAIVCLFISIKSASRFEDSKKARIASRGAT